MKKNADTVTADRKAWPFLKIDCHMKRAQPVGASVA